MGRYKNINPGPGAYNPRDLDGTKQKPKYTFGLRGAKGSEKMRVPGPGAYEHKSLILRKHSAKFGRDKRNMLA